ncbi:MAG: hypothetical protein ACYCS7_13675 [Acidimicrobiales bacterium]
MLKVKGEVGQDRMARSGRRSCAGDRVDQGDTRCRLVDGAIEALREDGFGGASARAIAGHAGCNQALVFYPSAQW